eukprot:765049-Hanusia_phi.AAC.2
MMRQDRTDPKVLKGILVNGNDGVRSLSCTTIQAAVRRCLYSMRFRMWHEKLLKLKEQIRATQTLKASMLTPQKDDQGKSKSQILQGAARRRQCMSVYQQQHVSVTLLQASCRRKAVRTLLEDAISAVKMLQALVRCKTSQSTAAALRKNELRASEQKLSNSSIEEEHDRSRQQAEERPAPSSSDSQEEKQGFQFWNQPERSKVFIQAVRNGDMSILRDALTSGTIRVDEV